MASKYKRIKIRKNKTRDLHRILKEFEIGRQLSFNEVVHHLIDGNDNPKFTIIMNRSEHSKLHGLGTTIKRKSPISDDEKERYRLLWRGEKSNSAKLTNNSVFKIREMLRKGMTLREVAYNYGVSHRTILRIKQKETWSHI